MRGAALTVALLLLPAGPALAGTVSRSDVDTEVVYIPAGAANVVVTDTVDAFGSVQLTVAEAGISITGPPNGCTDNGDSVTCSFPPGLVGGVRTTLTSASDTFNAGGLSSSDVSVTDQMGGDDILTGGQLALTPDGFTAGDSLLAGPGRDQIYAGAGNDQTAVAGDDGDLVELGPGRDRLITIGYDGVPGTFRGGEGTEDLLWPRSSPTPSDDFQVDLGAGTLTVLAPGAATDTIGEFENVQTDDGNDVILGDAGPNQFRSGEGNDRLEGRLGSDHLFAEAGNDRLEAQDGVADRVNGGAGADTCLLDQLDEDAECETRELATLTPFGAILPDVDPADCTLPGLRRRQPVRRLARRGLVVRVACDEAGRVSARLTGRLRRLGGRAVLARAGEIELAARSARLGSDGRARLRLRVGRRLRGLLRKQAALRLQVTAVDAAGNRSRPLVRRVRLR